MSETFVPNHGGDPSVWPTFNYVEQVLSEIDDGDAPWAKRWTYLASEGNQVGQVTLYDDGTTDTVWTSYGPDIVRRRLTDASDVEPWLSRDIYYQAPGVLKATIRLEDSLLERVVTYDAEGHLQERITHDHGDVAPWTSWAFFYDGETAVAREIVYDNGLVDLERTDFAEGVHLTKQRDAGDVYAWEEKLVLTVGPDLLDLWDINPRTGAVGRNMFEYLPPEEIFNWFQGSTVVYAFERQDNGDTFWSISVDGTQTRTFEVDGDGTYPWVSRGLVYDTEGMVTRQILTMADSRIIQTTFVDGNRTVRVEDDAGDRYDWSSWRYEFNADGEFSRTERRDDDGIVTVSDYDETGGRSRQEVTDTRDLFRWQSKVMSWDADGDLTQSVVTYDSGVVFTTTYDDGVVLSRVAEDRSDRYAWDRRDWTYDADGRQTDFTETVDLL
ncbi:hypothetical protein [Jannaschia sp. AI_61]|uniref:hypothetical protein n=1 Tax=Jannaschia sp. AI_61 TaxID=2829796 RepID=UPI001C7D4D05|nr:hypothetical protein [Jannaschia sp. AI_61]